MRRLLTIAFAVAAAVAVRADDPDLAARLNREFARLASDDASERDAGVEAIAKEGRAAEPAVRTRMQTEKDPEVKGRLARVLQRIEILGLARRTWTRLWSCRPVAADPLAAAISPDGRWASSLGEDGGLVVWDAATGKPLRELQLDEIPRVCFLCFNADGSFLAAALGEPEEHLRVWNTKSGAEINFTKREALPHRIQAATGPQGATVYFRVPQREEEAGLLWVVDAGGAVVLGHDQHFEAISPDGLRIALADVTPDSKFKDVATTVLLEASSGKEIRKVEFGHAADPDFPVSIAPDASAVASIEGGRIRYRSLETDQAELEFGTGAKWLAWHGKALVTAHADGSVRWWSGGKVVRVVEKAIENLERVDVKSGCVLANGSERPEPRRFRDLACVLNADSGAVLDRFEMKGNPFAWGGLVFDFFGECDTRVFCSGKLALRLPASESGDSLWSGRTWFGGDRALVVGHKRMTLHDLAHGDATTALPQHVSRVHELEWFEEGLHVAGSDSSVLIGNDQLHSTAMLHYQAAITCGRHTLDLGPLGLDEVGKGAISADGRWLAVRMRNHVLFRPTDPAGEARVLGEDCPKDWQGAFPSHPIAIAADGSLVAAVSANLHSVDVWESSTGRRLATIAKEGSSIEDLEVVPGSCNIVVMGPCDDKTGLIRVFKPTGELVSSNKWPLYWTGSSHFVHGRWEIASKDIDDLPSEIWILDVTQAAPPVRLVLPSGGNFTMPCVHESGDGDHVIVENLQDRRVYLLSCRDSSVLPLGDWDLGAIGVAGFLDRVHPVRIGPGGLALYYGPTVEKVSCDPAIRGQALAVSPDGKRVAVADGGTVTVYELR